METITCTIEHHATLYALLSKAAITLNKEDGRAAILAGTIRYGNERGARMAKNALANGDSLSTMNSQLYGEWKPDYEGQMIFGRLQTSPSLQTFISKCAWCEAWKKHNLLEYGKLYCIDVDNAVYQGFNPEFICTPLTTAMSWGGSRCDFDWENPLSDEEVKQLVEKKAKLGSACMKDFTFHAAHLLYAMSAVINETLPNGKEVLETAKKEFVSLFGDGYLEAIEAVDPSQF